MFVVAKHLVKLSTVIPRKADKFTHENSFLSDIETGDGPDSGSFVTMDLTVTVCEM